MHAWVLYCAEFSGNSRWRFHRYGLPSRWTTSALRIHLFRSSMSRWFFCRLSLMSCAAYSPLPLPSLRRTVRAFLTRVSTSPSADFSRPVRMDHSILSHDFVTNERSPEVSSSAFRAQPLDLHPVPLRIWASRSFARSPGTVCVESSSCPSAPAFAPRFFQTPPHDDALALRYHFTSIRL
jgi:hypothetical protein